MSNVVITRPVRNPVRTANNHIKQREGERWGLLIVFCLAHIPLALLVYRSSLIATVHALISFGIGLYFALSGSRHLPKAVYVCAYIAGAEVLWRMTNADIFWEFGKYAPIVIFLLAMFRNNRFKGAFGPILYFALLLPSTLLTLQAVDMYAARRAISFNLSGPFALMVCSWFFSNIKLSTLQVQKMLLFFATPILGIAGIAQYVMQTSAYIRFTSTASNEATSGGFAPNQVSAILGLGALMFFLFMMVGKAKGYLRIFAIAGMLFLAAQSALTFSRGGLYNVVGSLALAGLFFIKDPRTRARLLPLLVVAGLVIYFILLPQLDNLTGGTLSARFQNTDSTNRYDVAMDQIEVWKENPVLGVGPGQAPGRVAHTEATRLLAEHGSFGLLALLSLVIMAAYNIKRAPTTMNKALGVAMVSWSFLFMINAGMRLVAPSFAFGLSFLMLLTDEQSKTQKPAGKPARGQIIRASGPNGLINRRPIGDKVTF